MDEAQKIHDDTTAMVTDVNADVGPAETAIHNDATAHKNYVNAEAVVEAGQAVASVTAAIAMLAAEPDSDFSSVEPGSGGFAGSTAPTEVASPPQPTDKWEGIFATVGAGFQYALPASGTPTTDWQPVTSHVGLAAAAAIQSAAGKTAASEGHLKDKANTPITPVQPAVAATSWFFLDNLTRQAVKAGIDVNKGSDWAKMIQMMKNARIQTINQMMDFVSKFPNNELQKKYRALLLKLGYLFP